MESLEELLDNLSIQPFRVNSYHFDISKYDIHKVFDIDTVNIDTDILIQLFGTMNGESFESVTRIPGRIIPVVLGQVDIGMPVVDKDRILRMIAESLLRDVINANPTQDRFIEIAKHIMI